MHSTNPTGTDIWPYNSAVRRTRIKICGIRDIESAELAADAGVDAIGLVFVEKSPRCISVDEAEKIVACLPAFIDPVALFVDASAEFIRTVCRHLGVRTVQLHGHETAEFAETLGDFNVIKAIAFDAENSQASLQPWIDSTANVVGLLWDTPPIKADDGSVLTGGSGKTFDWNGLASLQASGALNDLPPTILAGGLTAANVGQAIATASPFAVDVSSGVESSRGVKDARLINEFCQAVREADERFAQSRGSSA